MVCLYGLLVPTEKYYNICIYKYACFPFLLVTTLLPIFPSSHFTYFWFNMNELEGIFKVEFADYNGGVALT